MERERYPRYMPPGGWPRRQSVLAGLGAALGPWGIVALIGLVYLLHAWGAR